MRSLDCVARSDKNFLRGANPNRLQQGRAPFLAVAILYSAANLHASVSKKSTLSRSLTLCTHMIGLQLSYANKGGSLQTRRDCRLTRLFRFTRGRLLWRAERGMIIFLYRPRCHGVGSKKQDGDITREPAPVTGVAGQTCSTRCTNTRTCIRIGPTKAYVPPTDNNYGRG